MRWTEQQSNAIETKGSDILVSAAAGSGKTAVLTERIKRLVLDDGISINSMLVVTFSNAAAAEMKEKIIKALNAAIEADPARSVFLRSQIRKARTADISTFHKFSMGVIKRYFYLTDVEQNFTICDEGRRQIIIDEVLDQLIEDRFAGEISGDREIVDTLDQAGRESIGEDTEKAGMTFADFLKDYCSVKNENDLRTMILEVYKFIMSMPDPFLWLDEAVKSVNVDEDGFRDTEIFARIKSSQKAECKKALNLCKQVYDMVQMVPSIEGKAALDIESVEAVVAAVEEGSDEALRAALEMKFQSFRANKADSEDFNLIKDQVKIYRDKVKKIIKTMQSDLSLTDLGVAVQRVRDTYPASLYLADLVKDFHSRFMAKKREKNLLDFNDIEHIALEILRHDEIAEEYRNHFEVIFIDEYQDSSILQETLISCISRGNNVYMVGDVKQSIYKFRLAEPEIFINKYNDFREGRRPGIRIDLNKNFRSKGNIIKAINGIFMNIMNRDTGGIDYDDDAALHKGSSYEGELDRKVTLHLIDSAVADDNENPEVREDTPILDEEIMELQSTELEARVVAKLVEQRIGMEIWDQKKECVRKVGLGDIVVLLRGVRGAADIYAEALKDLGIPAHVEAGQGYFETTEIEVFMNLLRIIDNRRKDIPLLSVLRSPIFGFSIQELVKVRLICMEDSCNEAFIRCASYAENPTLLEERNPKLFAEPETAALIEKCAAVCKQLDEWRINARYMPLENFLWKLMKETDYLDYVSALPGGERRGANLRTLVDKAVEFTQSQSKGLFGFINYVEALNNSNVSIGQAMQSSDTENMVKIMTIHKSKGLEFPVVILGGLGKKFNTDKKSSKVIMHKDLGLALQYVDRSRSIFSKTISHRVIAKQKESERLAEEMRILYVAMTRAMDELVMVGTVKNVEALLEKASIEKGNVSSVSGFMGWILPNIEDADIELNILNRIDLASGIAKDNVHIEEIKKEMEDGFPDFQDTEGYMEMIQHRFDFQYPYNDDVSSKSKFAVSELNKMLKGKSGEKNKLGDSFAHGVSIISETAAETLQDNQSGKVMKELREKIPLFMKEQEPITSMKRGTLVHKVLELITFREGIREAEIKSFIAELVEKRIMEEKEAEAIDINKILSFFESETGQRACKAKFLKKEWAFTLRKPREEIVAMAEDFETAAMLKKELPEKLLIQGVIDCCFRDEEGLVIVDYKTDWVDRKNKTAALKRLKEAYKNQLALYREVVEKALGEKVSKTMLFLIDSGDIVEI